MRPNTEDFLTFLCFRGTSSLPKELDFTNSLSSSQPSTSGTAAVTKNSSADKSNKKQDKVENKKKPNSKGAPRNGESGTVENDTNKEKKEEPEPVVEKPEVKKPFMPFAVRKRAEVHPVRNDKKKLQANKKKQSQQSTQKEVKPFDNKETKIVQVESRVTRSNPVEEKVQNKSLDDSKKGNKRKSQTNEESSEGSHTINVKNIKLDKSPRIELTPIEKVPIELLKKDSKTSTINKRNSEKLEDAKRQTRLSALKNPKPPDETSKKMTDDESASSDSDADDEPLVKSIKPEQKSVNKRRKEPNNSKADPSINKTKLNPQPVKTTNELPVTNKSNSSKKKEIVQETATKANEPQKSVDSSKNKPELKLESMEKRKVGRKKKVQLEEEKAHSQANTTDLSENETRSRPMRKTKEAATIYMELIGRKLTLHDSSDNDSSLDSLEVPNLKRVELLENECKANVEKAKEAEAERKRLEEKVKIYLF